MILTIADRLMFGAIFPDKASYDHNILIEDIKKKIILKQDEIKRINFRSITDEKGRSNYTWNEKKTDVSIIFTELELNFLKERVEKLGKTDDGIPVESFSIFKKIKEASLIDENLKGNEKSRKGK